MSEKKISVNWMTTADLSSLSGIVPTGGQVYELYLKNIIHKNYHLELVPLIKSIEGTTWQKMRNKFQFRKKVSGLSPEADVVLCDPAVATFLSFHSPFKSIVLVHHLGLKRKNLREKILYNLMMDRTFYRKLTQIDVIVTVSEYWRKYFQDKGHSDVRVIHNPVDITDYVVSPEEIENFKADHHLSGKPVIYLGTARKGKGADAAYEQLRDSGAYLITSGKKELDIPTVHLDLGYKDYVKLLAAADLAVLMSDFEEGWNRVAQEAMLCGTPVIGSGLGGMGELLSKGGQIVCRDHRELKEYTWKLVGDQGLRLELGEKGRRFARQFDLGHFEREWKLLISELASRKTWM